MNFEKSSAHFKCNVCSHSDISHVSTRGDGKRVLFCKNCGMGVIEDPPADASSFYDDGYYGSESGGELGYEDYSSTAEHSLLWAKLMVEALSTGGRLLDVGCADGFLLRKIAPIYEKYGIEVNASAAKRAGTHGVKIIANDVMDAVLKESYQDYFDVITSIATFEHVLDFRGAFRACINSLKTEGIMIFEVPLISDHRDNKDWLEGSFEHIYYPTIQGIESLLLSLEGISYFGFESEIKGYSSTYIGAIARNTDNLARAKRLLSAMQQNTLDGLDETESNLNLAYNVIHSFQTTPERVLALPNLIQSEYSPNLIARLIQLWHLDSIAATNAKWHAEQARRWENSYHEAAEAIQWHKQQAQNWEAAFKELQESRPFKSQ